MFNNLRIGHSKDIHPLIKGHQVILGNVEIACDFQVDAHSDGDVLIHAIAEAIIGALGKGDLGTFFPVKTTLKNISSAVILKKALALMAQDNYQIINIDCLIVCDVIKIAPIRTQIINRLATLLNGVAINLKATTSEKQHSDFIEAHAVVLIYKK